MKNKKIKIVIASILAFGIPLLFIMWIIFEIPTKNSVLAVISPCAYATDCFCNDYYCECSGYNDYGEYGTIICDKYDSLSSSLKITDIRIPIICIVLLCISIYSCYYVFKYSCVYKIDACDSIKKKIKFFALWILLSMTVCFDIFLIFVSGYICKELIEKNNNKIETLIPSNYDFQDNTAYILKSSAGYYILYSNVSSIENSDNSNCSDSTKKSVCDNEFLNKDKRYMIVDTYTCVGNCEGTRNSNFNAGYYENLIFPEYNTVIINDTGAEHNYILYDYVKKKVILTFDNFYIYTEDDSKSCTIDGNEEEVKYAVIYNGSNKQLIRLDGSVIIQDYDFYVDDSQYSLDALIISKNKYSYCEGVLPNTYYYLNDLVPVIKDNSVGLVSMTSGNALYDTSYDKAVIFDDSIVLYKDNYSYIIDGNGGVVYTSDDNSLISGIDSKYEVIFVVNSNKLEVRNFDNEILNTYNDINIENSYACTDAYCFWSLEINSISGGKYDIYYSNFNDSQVDYHLKYDYDTNTFLDLSTSVE